MIELVKLHHVSFTVKDLEASKRFYRDVLGLAELPRPDLQARGAWLAVGDRQIHLIEGSYRRKESENVLIRSDHVALEVRDLEGVREKLRSRLWLCGSAGRGGGTSTRVCWWKSRHSGEPNRNAWRTPRRVRWLALVRPNDERARGRTVRENVRGAR